MTTPFGASNEEIKTFIRAAHDVAAKGLVRCSSGNLSQRVVEDVMLITGSRSWMETLAPENLAFCRISEGEWISGAPPSVETAFHAGILRLRPETKVVLHFQSPFATVVACRKDLEDLPFNLTPEMPYYIGKPGVVPFLLPGSPELAEAVIDSAANHHLVVLRNHGQVTYGASFEETIQRAVFFEMTCELLVRGGASVKPLNDQMAGELMAMAASAKKRV